MRSTVFKEFSLKVTEANKTFSQTFELDKNLIYVRGLSIDADRPDLIYFRGSQRVEINKYEIFPEDYLSRKLMSDLGTAINTRYYIMRRLETGNKLIKIDFKDTDAYGAAFAPYTVFISVRCEKEDDDK